MSHLCDYICSRCGKREPSDTRKPKCDCGGLWELDFRPEKFTLDGIDRGEWSIFREGQRLLCDAKCITMAMR